MAIELRARAVSELMPTDCSFSTGDWRILSRCWFPIVALADLGSRPVSLTLLDVELVAYRVARGPRVVLDRCPHRGAALSMGELCGEDLICPYHGLHFGPDGRCAKIPAQPDIAPSAGIRLHTFPCVERYGLLWTCLDPTAGEPQIPPFAAWDRPDFLSVLLPHVDMAAAAGRQIEGFIDVAHFAWVHRETFGGKDSGVVPRYETHVTQYGLRAEYLSDVSNYSEDRQHLAPPGFRWLRVFDIYPPFCAALTVHFPNDGRLCILNLASPVSATQTRLFVPWARNFDVQGPISEILDFNAKVFAEDRAIVERQRPQQLPLNPKRELHFAADRSSVGYRRLLRQMGLRFDHSTSTEHGAGAEE
jgi:vanillate O-demethylase monooxygenase subunit